MSEIFYFKESFIEFNLSITYNDNLKLIMIPYSIRDGESHICYISFDNIPWLPNNLKDYFTKIYLENYEENIFTSKREINYDDNFFFCPTK